MEIADYRKELLEEVKVTAHEGRNFEASAFVDVAARMLADAGEISDFEVCYFRGTGSRRRNLAVDGFAFDLADDSVRVIVADWDGRESAATLTQTDAKIVLGKARAFVEDSLEARLFDALENASEAYAFSKELHLRRADLSRCRVYLVTDKTLSTRIRDFPEGRVGAMPVEYHIWDAARFQRVADSSSGQDEIEVDFETRIQGGIPSLAASLESDQYKAYLCVIRGDVLANIYDEFGSRLLEGNVRSFLSSKGKINKGIRASIFTEPGMFFAYNNGIAATASEAQLKSNGEGLRLARVKGLQIVNGGQTTASLAAALREGGAALDSIFVQMKLSVVPTERAGEVVPSIAKYANSQNKVNDADFFSNHDFHRRLETYSRQVWAPAVAGAQHESHWFYERARGQYVNEQARMARGEKKRFQLQNPRSQVVAKTDVAKVENIWECLPHIVCLGAQKNFLNFAERIGSEWKASDAGFNRAYFERLIAKLIIFRDTEKMVPDQSWYTGGYRAQIVAYTIAKFAHMIATQTRGKAVDLGAVWARQSVSKATREVLEQIALRVHGVLVSPDSGYGNVTEWSKREQCWRRVAAIQIDIPAQLSRELIDHAVAIRDGDSRQEREDRKINGVFDVVALGGKYWSELEAWGRARGLWSTEETRFLTLAAKTNFVPVDRQAMKLLKIRAKGKSEGFPK